MDEPKIIATASDLPYPPVAVDGKNPAYAKAMLDNVGGANSEMSAISLYVYNNLRSGHTPDIAQTFHKVSIVVISRAVFRIISLVILAFGGMASTSPIKNGF